MKRFAMLLILILIFTGCNKLTLDKDFSSDKFAVSLKYSSENCSVFENESGISIKCSGAFEFFITSFFVATLQNDITVQLGDDLLLEFPDATNVKTTDGTYFGIPGFLVSFDVSETASDGKVNLYYVTDGKISFSVFERSYPSKEKVTELKNKILNSIILMPEMLAVPDNVNELPKIIPEIIPHNN